MKNINTKPLSILKLVIILLHGFYWARMLYSFISGYLKYASFKYLTFSPNTAVLFWLLIAIILTLASNAVISIMILSRRQVSKKSTYIIALALSIILLTLELYCFYRFLSNIAFQTVCVLFSLIAILSLSIIEFINRDTKEQEITSSTSSTGRTLDNLVKYKELLDMGAITQEEFDEKKKQLLNN